VSEGEHLSALEGHVMRAIILHWTNQFDLRVERYGPRAKEAAFGFAAAMWVAFIFVVVHFERGLFPG
jgi:hypothetical protein